MWLTYPNLTNEQKILVRKLSLNFKIDKAGVFKLEDNIFNDLLFDRDVAAQRKIELQEGHIPVEASELWKVARDYQREDLRKMIHQRFVFNRNKPGYGKTFETIAYCRTLGLQNILIVCPKSIIEQWKDQFARWWPESKEWIVDKPRTPAFVARGTKGQIFITNYEQLRKTDLQQRCKMYVWDLVCVDESHRIKNPKAKQTIAIKGIPASHKMLLTGTPILRNPDDLWSQLNFFGSEISGGNYYSFLNRFCDMLVMGTISKIQGLHPSEQVRAHLRRTLDFLCVGGREQAVTKGMNRIFVDLKMEPKQMKLYRDITKLCMEELDKNGITVKNAMEQCIRQQQASTIPNVMDPSCKNPKFEWIRDWLADNPTEKAVVFTKYASVARALQEYLDAGLLFIGDLAGKEREKVKQTFIASKDVKHQLLIGTTGALGESIDGLQNVCWNVIFLDREWTPGKNEQAEKRIERSGQEFVANVWILQMKGTIDKHIEKIVGRRAEDIKEVFKNACGDD